MHCILTVDGGTAQTPHPCSVCTPCRQLPLCHASDQWYRPRILRSQTPQHILEEEAWLWVGTFSCPAEGRKPGVQPELVPLKYGAQGRGPSYRGLRVVLLTFPQFNKRSSVCTQPSTSIPCKGRRVLLSNASSWVPHTGLRTKEGGRELKTAPALGTEGTGFQFWSCHPLAKPVFPQLQNDGHSACPLTFCSWCEG